MLALTAAFYAPLRAQGAPFFDYPQHFALITGIEDPTSLPETVKRCWTHLDVWPASQWIALSSDRAEVFDTLCSLQINRLLWPADRPLSPPSEPLPTHIYKLLNARLTQVLTYGSTEAQTDVEIALSGETNELWEQALSAATPPVRIQRRTSCAPLMSRPFSSSMPTPLSPHEDG